MIAFSLHSQSPCFSFSLWNGKRKRGMLGILKDKDSEKLENSAFGIFRKKHTVLDLLAPLLPFLQLQQSQFCCGDLIPLLLSISDAALSIKQE